MRIVSYNILAPSYVRPEWYPFTDRALLAWEARRERLIARLKCLDGDVLCLQEVEPYIFTYLQRHLEPGGYSGIFAQKGQNRPDGSATFYRTDCLKLAGSRSIYYHDGAGDADSGHLALIARFEKDGVPFGVANTHIRWDRHDLRGDEHVGYRQATELLQKCGSPDLKDWVLCGDFNARPDTDLIRQIVSREFVDAYAPAPQPTANSDRCAKRIDYLFHTAAFASEPEPLPPIDDETPLPSETEPSDHLPVSAEFMFTRSAPC